MNFFVRTFKIILLFLFCINAYCLPPKVQFKKLVWQAEKLKKEKKFSESAGYYERAFLLDVEPPSTLFFINYAQVMMETEDYSKAINGLEKFFLVAEDDDVNYETAMNLYEKAEIDMLEVPAKKTKEKPKPAPKPTVKLDPNAPGGFFQSISKNNPFGVMNYLAKNGDVNAVSPKGETGIYLAASNNNDKVVKLLLDQGADPNLNKKGSNGTTPLFVASHKGYQKVVEVLLKYKGIDLSSGYKGYFPLWMACQRGHTKIAELLLNAGADVNQRSGDNGKTTLWLAVERNNGCLDLLLRKRANVNLFNDDGLSLVESFILGNHGGFEKKLGPIKKIISKGGRLRFPIKGRFPVIFFLSFRAYKGVEIYEERFNFLLKYLKPNQLTHIDLKNIQEKKVYPLPYLINNINFNQLKLLLNAGANPNIYNEEKEDDLYSGSPLRMAITGHKSTQFIEEIAKKTKDLNTIFSNHKVGKYSLFSVLIGNDYYSKNIKKLKDIISVLVKNGANINLGSPSPGLLGAPPLMLILLANNYSNSTKVDLIKHLISLGASPNQKAKNGKSLLDIANQKNCESCTEALYDGGAEKEGEQQVFGKVSLKDKFKKADISIFNSWLMDTRPAPIR